MFSWNLIPGPVNIFSAIVTSFSGLLAVILGYMFKNKKQQQDHMMQSWEELIEENSKFREEIRKDLQTVKEERDSLGLKVHDLEVKLSAVIKENLELKRKEIEMTCEIKYLKEQNIMFKNKIEEQDKAIVLLTERGR
jgi:septal ring factor EnvC (AmiA/AmiB activator)